MNVATNPGQSPARPPATIPLQASAGQSAASLLHVHKDALVALSVRATGGVPDDVPDPLRLLDVQPDALLVWSTTQRTAMPAVHPSPLIGFSLTA